MLVEKGIAHCSSLVASARLIWDMLKAIQPVIAVVGSVFLLFAELLNVLKGDSPHLTITGCGRFKESLYTSRI